MLCEDIRINLPHNISKKHLSVNLIQFYFIVYLSNINNAGLVKQTQPSKATLTLERLK